MSVRRYMYLHGFCSGPSSQKLNFFRERFADHGIELYTPDLNLPDFTRMTITSQLEVARAAMVQADPEASAEWVLLGSSLGAYLAAHLARENENVKELVLFAPAFQFITRNRERLGAAAIAAWRERGTMDFQHYHYKEERPLSFDIVTDAERYDELDFPRDMPALLFHGLADDLVPYELSIDYVKSHPSASLVLFADDHQLIRSIEKIWSHTRIFLELDES